MKRYLRDALRKFLDKKESPFCLWSIAAKFHPYGGYTIQNSGVEDPTFPGLITNCAQTGCISIKVRNRMNPADWHKQACYALHITRCELIALISKGDWDLGGINGAGRLDSLCIAENPESRWKSKTITKNDKDPYEDN